MPRVPDLLSCDQQHGVYFGLQSLSISCKFLNVKTKTCYMMLQHDGLLFNILLDTFYGTTLQDANVLDRSGQQGCYHCGSRL